MVCIQGILRGSGVGVVPGIFRALGKWPACVGFPGAMQAVRRAIALVGWRTPKMEEDGGNGIAEPRRQGSESI